jgi:hypothetical protein
LIRTFQNLSIEDLREIAQYGLNEFERFIKQAGCPKGKYLRYRDRLIAGCLVQGAAQHYIDLLPLANFDNICIVGENEIFEKGYKVTPEGLALSGVKDIDLIIFFHQDPLCPIPTRRHCMKSFSIDLSSLGPRRFDVMKKGVKESVLINEATATPSSAVRAYLKYTDHGRNYLAVKSVIGLFPESVFGLVIWATRRITPRSI